MYQTIQDIQNKLKKNEVWRNTNFDDVLTIDMQTPQKADCAPANLQCNIPNLEALRVETVNGFCQTPLHTTAEGIIVGSLRQALAEHPDLAGLIYNQTPTQNPFKELNYQQYSDGIFVYVPDNTTASIPIQLLHIYNANLPIVAQSRNCIYVGNNSRLTLIHCDDSLNRQICFGNNVTEIIAGNNAVVDHYKMQNLNDVSGLNNQTYVVLDTAAHLLSVAITLNGGHIRNHSEIIMKGSHCDVQSHGLYLNDKNQRVENYIYVDHAYPDCRSHELFKGILDDSAQGQFNGHVLVSQGASKTEAYMQNKNILLTDKAHIYTRPFLEIYNDDVKCSHGSTIGQIDETALFYLRSRGISEHTAKTLLLYAFCDEVIRKIQLPVLRDRLGDMVKQRLHGDLSVCAECALNCTSSCGCNTQEFKIDPTRL